MEEKVSKARQILAFNVPVELAQDFLRAAGFSSGMSAAEKIRHLTERLSGGGDVSAYTGELEREADELRAQVAALTADNTSLTDENKVLKDDNNVLKDENNVLKSDNTALKDENNVLKAENNVLTSDNNVLTSDNTALKERNSALTDEKNVLTASVKDLDQRDFMDNMDPFYRDVVESVSNRLGVSPLRLLLDVFIKYHVQRYALWFHDFIPSDELLALAQKHYPEIRSLKQLQSLLK